MLHGERCMQVFCWWSDVPKAAAAVDEMWLRKKQKILQVSQ